MRQQNGKGKSLSRTLRAENTILGTEKKKKQKETMNASGRKEDQERKHNIIKVVKNLLD